jgi:hypothetical protein
MKVDKIITITKSVEIEILDIALLSEEAYEKYKKKNPLRLQKPEWYVFTIRENGKRVGLKQMQKACEEMGLNMVPIEEIGTDLPSKYPTVEALLERADGNYSTGGKKEGIVVRPTEPVYSTLISGSLSFKVVSNKYLLK